MPVIDHLNLRVGASAVRALYHNDAVLSGPTLDLDFLDQNYIRMTSSEAFSDIITFSRASSATRINAAGVMETVASNVPRIAFDPVTLQPKGLLIEEQRTNRWSSSASVSIGWNSSPVTTTTNYGATPILGVNSSRFTRAADGSQTAFVLASSASAENGVSQCPSVFMKINSAVTFFSIYAGNGNSTSGRGFGFAVDGGIITPVDGAVILDRYADGWHRIAFPFVASAAISAYEATLVLSFPVGVLDVELVGTQWEAGAFATSYIPASGSQVTRAADVPVINTLSPWYSSNGAIYFEGDTNGVTGAGAILVGGSNSSNFYIAPNKTMAYFPGAGGATVTANACNFGQTLKGAMAWSASAFDLCMNGGVVVSDARAIASNTSLGVGVALTGALSLNGHVRKIRHYPRRLSNAQLQALTA